MCRAQRCYSRKKKENLKSNRKNLKKLGRKWKMSLGEQRGVEDTTRIAGDDTLRIPDSRQFEDKEVGRRKRARQNRERKRRMESVIRQRVRIEERERKKYRRKEKGWEDLEISRRLEKKN